MTGIVPNSASGGLPANNANVFGAEFPAAPFSVTCTNLGLPSDCTARITPEQINSIVSELLNLAACMSPNGVWACGSLDNLCSAFNSYRTGTGTNTLIDDVINNLNWKDCNGIKLTVTETIATCANVAAAINAAIAALVDDDTFPVGFVLNALTDELKMTLNNGNTFTVNLAPYKNLTPLQQIQNIDADVPASAALMTAILSTDAGNTSVLGSDQKIYTPQETPTSIVDRIQANSIAHCDLVNGLVDPLVTTLGTQNTQVGQLDIAPPVTENHGLTVDATNPCSLTVPYASKSVHGVVERVDFATMEARQNHNLYIGNVDTTLALNGDKFRLDDVRYMTARTNQEWFENNFWVQADTTFAIPSARFPTLKEFELYLADYRIKPDVLVTVNLAAGVVPLTGLLTGHPDGNRVLIKGAAMLGVFPTPAELTITSGAAVDRTADYLINKALFESRFATIIGVNSNLTVMRTGTNKLPYRFEDVIIRGSLQLYANSSTYEVGSYRDLLNRVVVDAGNIHTSAIILSNRAFISTNDVAILGSYTLVNANALYLQNGSFYRGSGSQYFLSSTKTNIEVRTHSRVDFNSASKVVARGAGNFNTLVIENSNVFFFSASVDLSNSNLDCVGIFDESSLRFAFGTFKARFAVRYAVNMDGNSGFGRQAQNPAYPLFDIGDCQIGIVATANSSVQLTGVNLAGNIISNCSIRGVQLTGSRFVSVFGVTYSGNASDMIASSGSTAQVVIAPVLTSPPVGTVGNNNSLIHL
jgi:hypothetical protein